MCIHVHIMWKYYALFSAFFAALTAIFAKIGVKDINSDLATAIRTTIILFITWGIALVGNHASEVKCIQSHTWLFLVFGSSNGLVVVILLQGPADWRCVTRGTS